MALDIADLFEHADAFGDRVAVAGGGRYKVPRSVRVVDAAPSSMAG
jgi:hypothetical protein